MPGNIKLDKCSRNFSSHPPSLAAPYRRLQAVAYRLKPVVYYFMTQKEFFVRRLPHWHLANATFFVTFGLEGSLPQPVVAQIQADYESVRRQLQAEEQPNRREELYRLSKQLFKRYDDYLDQGQGTRWLAQAEIARMVCEQIHLLHPEQYHLRAYCVMSTHVHLLVDTQDIPLPLPSKDGKQQTPLSYALFLLKGRTARQANLTLNRQGAFWRRESYDHVVRDEREYERIVSYILDNPVKAGLVENWQDYPYAFLNDTG